MTAGFDVYSEYSGIIGEELPKVFYRNSRFSLTSCGSCGSEVHTCGDVLSNIFLQGHGCSFCGIDGQKCLDNEMELVRGNTRHRVLAHGKLRELSWFHATVRDDWAESYNVEFTDVHVGSRLTALHRATQLLERDGSDFTMFELRVKSEASMTRRVEDSECLWPEMDSKRVSPYTNLYELSGSTSLYSHTNALEVVGSESLSMKSIRGKVKAVRDRELSLVSK